MTTYPTHRIFFYTVAYDYGFAPNPFHGLCTLATCKSNIRKAAQVGDYIAGKGSVPRNNTLVYTMIVDEVLTFDEYWNDERFQVKKPVMNSSMMMAYGDNIYHRPQPDEDYVQSHSHHSYEDGTTNEDHLQRDTQHTNRVLLGTKFSYFGEEGPVLPPLEYDISRPLRNMKYSFSEKDHQTLMVYLNDLSGKGYTAQPANW